MSGVTPNRSVAPAGRDRQAGLDLVEDQHDPVPASELADVLEVARLGQHDPEVHHRRLHDHAGRLASLGLQALDPPLHRARVVERHRDRELDHLRRDPGAVGQRGVVLAVADPVVLDADRHHHRVVVAVVGAEDLHDRVAARVAARDPDRVHRRLRAGVDEPPPVEAPAPLQLLGDDHAVLGRGGEVRAERDPLADGPDDRRVRVALDHRAEAVVEVPHAVAVDVVDDRPLAGRQVDRPRIARLIARRHAAAERLTRAAVHRRPTPVSAHPASRAHAWSAPGSARGPAALGVRLPSSASNRVAAANPQHSPRRVKGYPRRFRSLRPPTRPADSARARALSIDRRSEAPRSQPLRRRRPVIGSEPRRNNVYKAFRELGRAICTITLLRLISEPELRAQIDAATNKVESHNNFSGWLAFGAEGIERNDPAEQEKIIKFNTLLSNCVIFHIAIDMTTVVRGMITEGPAGRPARPCDHAPYVTERVKRFGEYPIDGPDQPP